jgi:hypothetical protein
VGTAVAGEGVEADGLVGDDVVGAVAGQDLGWDATEVGIEFACVSARSFTILS